MLCANKNVDLRLFGAVAAFILLGIFVYVLLSWFGAADEHEPGFRVNGHAIRLDAGTVQVTLDTSDPEQWVGFSFTLGRIVPEGGTADVYARRYLLRVPLGVVDLGGDPLVTATQITEPRWQFDRSSGDQRNSTLSDWYNYNFLSNRLSSRGHTFAVRTQEGVVHVQVVSYTCETREPGCLTLRYWKSLES